LDKKLKPFAEAIGEMCNEWALLEQWISRLFLSIGEWDYRSRNALVMVGYIDIRDQIKAAKIGAINRCPEGVFLDIVVASLDYIDNGLRTARNRFVHDIWSPAEDGTSAIRIALTPKAMTEVGTGARWVRHWENIPTALEEVREVTTDIINERNHVAEIVKCFQNPNDNELPARLSAPPPRLHLLRQLEWQSRTDSAAAKQKPPRKP
jgi:hypothetical protein